jgi:membrane-associated phospholipid phosphatase
VVDLYITNPAERTVPYLYTAVGFGFWCYLLTSVLRAPIFIDVVAIGATLALIGLLLINRRWKISAHLTGMGGLVGGVMSHSLATQQTMLWLPLVLMVLSLLLMYARIYLRAHDPLQVIAGFLFGLGMTFIPNMIISYVV